MKIRRFQGDSTREVLNQIRSALGPDAVILSNRSQETGGVEMVAAIDFDEQAWAESSQRPAWPQAVEALAYASPAANELPSAASQARAEASPAKASASPIRHELQALRQLVEKRWGRVPEAAPEPVTPEFPLEHLQALGFSADTLADLAPMAAKDGLIPALAMRLEARIGRLTDPLGSGGVCAVFGPTGSGKTTSIAKLAAQQVLLHGPQSVALFTSDTYRIAGVEQLGIYARILGVPVEVLRGPEDLLGALERHQERRWIFIDTMGLSPRDPRLGEQLQWLDALGTPLRRFLLLPAGLSGPGLDQVLSPYTELGLNAALLSKVDETPACAAALEWLAAHRLPLAWISNGQKVPEDMHLADWERLLRIMELDALGPIASQTRDRYHEA